jgi:HupE / UreJ protein
MKPRFYLLLFFFVYLPNKITAHPSPNSLVLLDIQSNGVAVELQLPVGELELALGQNIKLNTPELVAQRQGQLKAYLIQHINPLSISRQNWTIDVKDITLQPLKKEDLNYTQDVLVHLFMQPPTGTNSRYFILNYDVIMHQVATHNALVKIHQDWEAGINADNSAELGVISVDPRTNTIEPITINQTDASFGKGFKSMVSLGMKHIKEGTDHLLFLLVLLLAAPLLINGTQWGEFGGIRYSLIRLIKIITAFTIGHSITLLFGAMNWVKVPTQPIEILIAFSILISAIHAIRPIFPNKEAFVAAGFGLIHGLAFATTLSDLHLPTYQLAFSILGFNIGIELMQLLIMALIIPELILLSKTKYYSIVRIAGAVLASIAAIAWMIERYSGNANSVTAFIEKIF